MSDQFKSFSEFWPFYVCEHIKPKTRLYHFIGTASVFPLLLIALAYEPVIALLIPVSAYGFAWFSHFYIEKNRPATFIHPLWSLIGDCKMFWLMCRQKMDDEVIQCQSLRKGRTTK